ncbi:MAG: hypothetical protein JNK47_00295 [Mesorhizobium sp.]|nr:hypothetical protein [Mesorhizobium sp.]MBL8575636.1 hypothetical protein [Mesorhizobium sp.]
MSSGSLSAAERDILGSLADVLIPPATGAICASGAGVSGVLLDQAQSYAPDLPERLRGVIAKVGNLGPAQALQALKASDGAAYDGFCETIAAIYFLSPQVRAAVGFPGREPKPARVDVADLEELLLPVLEAGFAPRTA